MVVLTSLNPNLTPQNAPLLPPKMTFFNFGLEQKLDHYSCVKFLSNSDCNCFNFPKPQLCLTLSDPLIRGEWRDLKSWEGARGVQPQLNPQNAPFVPPKNKIFNFTLEDELDQHYCVEFHGESDSDCFNFPKIPA